MKKTRTALDYVIVSAFAVVGATVVSGIAFNYSGDIQIRFGADGMQVQVNGSGNAP